MAKRPYTCEMCGGNHSTSHCAPKNLEPKYAKVEIHPPQWCEFHQRWANHNTNNFLEKTKIIKFQDNQIVVQIEMKGRED